MLALAGVGVASILSGLGGVQVPLAGMLGNDIHAAWLASKPTASGSARSVAPAAAGSAPTTVPSGLPAAAVPGVVPSAGAAALAGAGPASTGMTEDGKVILNLASVEDLRHLPGVGPKRAEAILALRARLGHFKHVNDLLRVKGIGVKGLKKILPHIVLDGPKPVA
jgi:competence protein ComEA